MMDSADATSVNVVHRNRARIEKANYCRTATPVRDYWFSLFRNTVYGYLQKCGAGFHLVIAGADNRPTDFYAIPYQAVRHMLVDEYLTHEKTGKPRRWIGRIENHRLRINRCPVSMDVGLYYGNPAPLGINVIEGAPPIDENDYAIENRRAEINARQKQSVFRRGVLSNFEGRCCISGISETDLLVASHIVPWAHKIESRLDPANGLCLSVLCDRLFDLGFISIDDDLRVIVTPRQQGFSPELREILSGIGGRRIRSPIETPIRREYLAYHRERVFSHSQ